MSNVDKKNTWYILKSSSATNEDKMLQIVNHLKLTYPNIEKTGPFFAKFSIKSIPVFVWLYRNTRRNSVGSRITLRMSIDSTIIDKKTIAGYGSMAIEMSETYPYSDGSSRIDLDSIITRIKEIVMFKYERIEENKRHLFQTQLDQMKLVGRIQSLVSFDKYKVVKCDHMRNRVEIKNDMLRTVCVIEHRKDQVKPYCMNVAGGQYQIYEDGIDTFIKDAEVMFKYA